MSKRVCMGLMAVLCLSAIATAETLTIQNGVPNYSSLVKDAALRWEGTVNGAPWGEGNIGNATGSGSHRMYPDVGAAGGRGPRRYMTWFDVSSIPPNATVISATMSLWFQRDGSNAEAIREYKLSRLRAGKNWAEGVGQAPAADGSVSYNCQVTYPVGDPSRVQWEVAGVTGANDIDHDTTIVFDKSGPGISEYKDFDVTSWVQAWVDGSWENNGTLLWGGIGTGVDSYYGIGGKECTDVGGNLPKLIVEWALPGTCSSSVTPTDSQGFTGLPNGQLNPFATLDMGETEVSNGLAHVNAGDGQSTTAFMGGRSCRTNADPAAHSYMYFNIDLASPGSAPAVTISFDYYDLDAPGGFVLTYDAQDIGGVDRRWTDAPGSVALTGTNTWKRGSFTVTDAYFGNRQNYGSDFRIARTGDLPHFYINNVMVARSPEINYVFQNSGTVAIDWTAVVTNADGSTPPSYGWLSLDTAGGSALAGGATAPVKAIISTAGLEAGTYTGYVKFTDNCSTPTVTMRQIDLTVTGCQQFTVAPRSVVVAGAGSDTFTRNFTITNTGGYELTNFSVTKLGTYDWLSFADVTGLTLLPGASAELTATIDMALVPPGGQAASFRIACNCNGSTLQDDLTDAVTAVFFVPVTYRYEMNEHVGAPQSDLITPPMSIVASGYGDDLGADPGYGKIDQGNDCFESARFADTVNMSGNHAFYLGGLGNAPGADGFTVDMRIWAEEPTVGTLGRSAGLCNNLGVGRGIRIEPTSAADNSLQISFVASGPIAGGGPFVIPNNPANTSRFHMIRFVVHNDMYRIDVYDLENDLDPGPGVSWELVASFTALGSTSGLENLGITAGGILLNSNSGSGTTNSKWSADWIRILTNAALPPTAGVIGGVNPPCCNTPYSDTDDDDDVDQDDFGVLQACFNGDGRPFVNASSYCRCLNHHGEDNDIDSFDVGAFMDCLTGPEIPWSEATQPNCLP